MPDNPKRRWFRFSLRSLLVLVVVVAIPLGWIAKERRQSQREKVIAEQLRVQGAAGQKIMEMPEDRPSPALVSRKMPSLLCFAK